MRVNHVSLKVVQVISIVFVLLFVNENMICATAADAINRGYVLEIVKQPEDVLTAANGYVMFYVESNRENVTYQWYYQRPGTTGWGKFGESGGGTSQTLNRYVPRSWNGWKVRCEVTDGTEKVVSEEATITIKEIIPEVTIYLVSGDIEHGIKQSQSFCLTAEKKGGFWHDCG